MRLKSAFCVFLFFSGISAYSQSTEGVRNINGTRLFVKEAGKGEVLIVIHGGPGLNHSYFLPHLDPLAKKLKVVYYDQRACGQSAIPSVDSLSLSYFIDDIEAIRKMTGANKVNLLAHSWGTLLAVQYGITYPDRVNKMIVSNPVPLNPEYQKISGALLQSKTTKQDSLDRAELIASPAFKNQDVAATEALLKVIFRPSFYDREKVASLDLNLPFNYGKATTALYGGLGKDMQSYDYYDAIRTFTFPVLVVAGRADNIPMEAIERIQHNILGSKLIVFEKSGHFPFIEEQEKFTTEVISFLKNK